MYRTFFLVTSAAFLLLALVVVARPAHVEVRREVRVAAPPERVFEQLDTLERWEDWVRWPDAPSQPTIEYGPVRRGVGASRSWRGTAAQGSGRMSIVESRAPEHLVVELDFSEPAQAGRATLRFALAPLGDGTLVTLTYEGDHTLGAKAVALVVDAKHFIGVELDGALASLAASTAAVEAPEASAAPAEPAEPPAPTAQGAGVEQNAGPSPDAGLPGTPGDGASL